MYFVPQFTEATDIITLESVTFPMRFFVYLKKFIASIAITYFTFKYTILLSKQCWIKRCITRYDSLQFYIYLANTYSRYCLVTQSFINYGTMPVVKNVMVSSNNNIYYIQMHHFMQQTMLNQWLYYTRYNDLNLTLNLRVVVTTPLGSRCHNK